MKNCKTCAGLGCIDCENKDDCHKPQLSWIPSNHPEFRSFKCNNPSGFISINPDGETFNVNGADGVMIQFPKPNELKDMLDGMLNKVSNIVEYNTKLCEIHGVNSIVMEIPLNIAFPIELLLKEYTNACKKHPAFPDCKFKQFAILSEEVHEYNKEIQHDALDGITGSNTITELAQIGAVVLRMLEGHHGTK